MSDLKPCPFCGCQNVGVEYFSGRYGQTIRVVKCGDCRASGPLNRSERIARDLWNMRNDEAPEVIATALAAGGPGRADKVIDFRAGVSRLKGEQ